MERDLAPVGCPCVHPCTRPEHLRNLHVGRVVADIALAMACQLDSRKSAHLVHGKPDPDTAANAPAVDATRAACERGRQRRRG